MRWSKDDRDKALALHLRKQSTCPHCGTRREEWDERRGGDRRAYVADIDRCHGCEQMQAYDASLTAEDRKELGRGIYIVLRRRREA